MKEINILVNKGYTLFEISSLFGIRSTRFLRKVKDKIEMPSKSLKIMLCLETDFIMGKKTMTELNNNTIKELGINPYSLTPYANWVHPSTKEIKILCDLVGTSGEVGALVGASGRSVRKWIGGVQEIPYSVWAILALNAGIGVIWRKN
jgi:hypothetical protein